MTDASGTTTYQYTTQNGQIARQSWSAGGTAYQMDFIYDAAGRPLAMYYRTKTASQTDFNGDSYYYETNQQGDVTGLYKITYNSTTNSLTATRVRLLRIRRLGKCDLFHRYDGKDQPAEVSWVLPRCRIRVLLSAKPVL